MRERRAPRAPGTHVPGIREGLAWSTVLTPSDRAPGLVGAVLTIRQRGNARVATPLPWGKYTRNPRGVPQLPPATSTRNQLQALAPEVGSIGSGGPMAGTPIEQRQRGRTRILNGRGLTRIAPLAPTSSPSPAARHTSSSSSWRAERSCRRSDPRVSAQSVSACVRAYAFGLCVAIPGTGTCDETIRPAPGCSCRRVRPTPVITAQAWTHEFPPRAFAGVSATRTSHTAGSFGTPTESLSESQPGAGDP